MATGHGYQGEGATSRLARPWLRIPIQTSVPVTPGRNRLHQPPSSADRLLLARLLTLTHPTSPFV
jgi:hypothetical protein